MKLSSKLVRKLLCALLFHSASFGQEEVSVSDFRYPETRALDWKGGLFGDFGSTDYGFSDPFGESNANSTRGDFSLQTSGLFFHSTENHDNLIRLSAYFSYQQSKSTTDRQNRDGELENKYYDKRGNISGSWEYRHYPFMDEAVHFVGNASLTYTGSIGKQNTFDRNNSVLSSIERVQKSYALWGIGFVGIGYGRMRDGTFVIRALRILERLQEDGVITGSLSREQILDLIDRVAHTREYTTNFERHEKYLVLDIVSELLADGLALPEAGAPFSILKISEVLSEQIEPRFFGWRTYYALGHRQTQDYEDVTVTSTNPTQVSANHDFTKDGTVFHRVAAEYGYTVSQWTHFNTDVTLDVPALVSSKFFTLKYAAKAIHQIGERIDIVGTYQFYRSAGNYLNSAEDRYYTRSISHQLDLTFRLFLEDIVSFNTTFRFRREFENTYDAIPYPTNENRSQDSSRFSLSFGINYNII